MAENKAESKEFLTVEQLVHDTINLIQKEITEEEYKKIIGEITIKPYLPILKKLELIMNVIYEFEGLDYEQVETRAVALEKILFFDVLLSGYCNIKCIDMNSKTFAYYDILYPAIGKLILEGCGDDYKQLKEMLNEALNFYRIKELTTMFESIDYDKLAESNSQLSETVSKIINNKKLLDKVSKIMLNNTKFDEAISKSAQIEIKTQE